MNELYAVLTELVITESKRRPSLVSVFRLWLQFLPIPPYPGSEKLLETV